MNKNYHTAFGVYGIYQSTSDQLLVIKKNQGPYAHRYDLPGGSLGNSEGLSETLEREFIEETKLTLSSYQQLGTCTFRYPWQYQEFNYNKHIAVFYQIHSLTGRVAESVPQFPGQDSDGAVFVTLNEIDETNASPLVLKAKEYLLTCQFQCTDDEYSAYQVL